MGMYDHIEYHGELYQTKDLGSQMEDYKIIGKTLYKRYEYNGEISLISGDYPNFKELRLELINGLVSGVWEKK